MDCEHLGGGKHSSLFLFYWRGCGKLIQSLTRECSCCMVHHYYLILFACFTRYLHPMVQSSATVSAQCKEDYGDETARSTTRQEGTMEGFPFHWQPVLLTSCCCSSYSCPFSCSCCHCRRCCGCGDVHDIRGSMCVLWLSDFNHVPWCFVRCGLLFATD